MNTTKLTILVPIVIGSLAFAKSDIPSYMSCEDAKNYKKCMNDPELYWGNIKIQETIAHKQKIEAEFIRNSQIKRQKQLAELKQKEYNYYMKRKNMQYEARIKESIERNKVERSYRGKTTENANGICCANMEDREKYRTITTSAPK